MRLAPRHLRRLHSVPEVVLNRDLHKVYQNSTFSHKHQRTVPYLNNPQMAPRSGYPQNRYHQVLNELRSNPQFENILRVRTEKVQSFLGNKLPLDFPELLSVLCGLANMDIETFPLPAGTLFGDVFTQQDALRQLGARFFELHCLKSYVFPDIHYLSATSSELEQSMVMFANHERLITKLMDSSELSECVIPYRGVHSAERVRSRTDGFRREIKAKSCVASFHTMLGILVRKFGSDTTLREFWEPKMLHPTQGLLRLALNDKS